MVNKMQNEQFTDSGFLEQVKQGDRKAIQAFCADLAQRLRTDGIHDQDVTYVLSDILEKIGQGISPDSAFRWKQSSKGRRDTNDSVRDFLIRKSVQERMLSGQTFTAACLAVSSEAEGHKGEFHLGAKSIQNICKGITRNTDIQFPDNPFPIGNLMINRSQEIK